MNTKKHSPEHSAKIAEALRGRKLSPEHAQKNREHGYQKGRMRGENNPFFGRKHSDESKEKMRRRRLGTIVSPETRLKISGANNKNWRGGEIETRRRISEKRKMVRLADHNREKEYHREWRLKRKESMAGRPRPSSCEICSAIGKIVYDHNHYTGVFRGWICSRCNTMLGMARDNVDTLAKAVAYLNPAR